MPKAILLATDNLQVGGTFKRIAQEHALSVEVVSSVSDGVMAFIQSMHDMIFLSPGMEGGRGMYLVQELASLSPHIVLLGEARKGFAHLELPLVESKVLACLGLEKKKVAAPVPIVIFDAKKPPTLSKAVAEEAAKTTETQAPVEEMTEEIFIIEEMPVAAQAKSESEEVFQVVEEAFHKAEEVFQEAEEVFFEAEDISRRDEDALGEEPGLLEARISDLSGQLAVVSEQKTQAEAKLQQTEEAISKLEGKLQTHRRMHGKLEAELEKTRAELALLKAQQEAALQTGQELQSQAELFQQEKEHAKGEVKNIKSLLERELEERTLWQESKSELSLEMQKAKEKLTQIQEEKDIACLQLAEVNEKWRESEARLQAAVSQAAFSQAEMEALKTRAQQAEAALEEKNAEFERQTLSSQKRIAKMEEELVQLRSQVAKSEAEVKAALAMAPATVILPLSSPMPGDVFSALEECLQWLVQTVATRPWLRLDAESRLGRRKLYICQGSLVGVDSNCPGDVLLRQAQRDGLISSKQYQGLRLLEERSPNEQLETLLRKGFIREIEAEGLLQRYAERVVFEAMSQREAAFALVEEKPGEEVTVLKAAQPLWPLLKEGIERRNTEAHFLERFGGMGAIPVLKTNLAGLVAMGISNTEKRFFESMDAQTRLEDLLEDLGLKPKQTFSILLAAWKLGVIEFSKKSFAPVGVSQVSTERLFARFEEIRDADYFDVLGVSQEASTRELREAHMRLVEEFNPLKFAGHGDPKVFSCAEQLTALVEEAFLVLENENQRKEYAHHLMSN